jgi:redox-sensitive bicupin YhaK (pirin superfamily)
MPSFLGAAMAIHLTPMPWLLFEEEVMMMSKGSGLRHAEFNGGSEPLKLFQIWLHPNEIDQDMVLGANTQATRDRVIAEIRQARADGKIKSWSSLLLEVPFKAPRSGVPFASLSAHQLEGGAAARMRAAARGS